MGLTTYILMLSLSVLVSDAAYTPPTNEVLAERLYNNVIVGDYDNAVTETRVLEEEQKSEVIEQVVTRLLRETKRNIVEYAYQLWIQGLQETVKHHFPIQFRLIVGENHVKIIDRTYGFALKLDNDGGDEKLSYGDAQDKTSQRVSWKFIPEWDDNRVYFSILNTHHKQYLNQKVTTYGLRAFGSDDNDTYGHQWYLHPVMYDNEVLFYIFNREHNDALYLEADTDSVGDRIVLSHHGNVFDKPNFYGWSIVPF